MPFSELASKGVRIKVVCIKKEKMNQLFTYKEDTQEEL